MKYRFVEYEDGSVQIQKQPRFCPVWLFCELPDMYPYQYYVGVRKIWSNIEEAKKALNQQISIWHEAKRKKVWPVDVVIKEVSE